MRNLVFNARQGWLMTMLLSCLVVSAYDFKVGGIYYNVTDMDNLECEVTKGDNPYVRLEIPSTVTFNNRTFTVKRIGDEACNCNYDLRRVTIPATVTSIGDKAFFYCSHYLTTIIIPDSVLSIGEKAFEYCENLKVVTIGDAVTDIGRMAFGDCKSLTDLKIGNSVKKIGNEAFGNCESLKSVVLPNSVENMGEEVFLDCRELSKVILSNGLKELNVGTFSGCRSLTELKIPGGVDKIVGRRYLPKIDLFPYNLRILSLDYSENPLIYGEFGEKKLRDRSIVQFFFPGTVTGFNSFEDMWYSDALTDVYIDRKLNVSMKLPNVRNFSLGKHIKKVQVIDLDKYEHLESITCYANEPPVLPECSKKQYLNVVVKVPQEALEKYKQAPVWKEFWNLQGDELLRSDKSI